MMNVGGFGDSSDANMNFQNSEGFTPIIWAAKEGHENAVRQLLENGADINLPAEDGWTPIMWAVFNGHVNIVELLLDKGADVNVQDKNGWTLLKSAAAEGHVHVVRLLLNRAADINLQDTNGWTPIMSAVNEGHVEIVEFLLQRGADISLGSKNGGTVLSLAKQGRLKNGKKINLLIQKYTCAEIFTEVTNRSQAHTNTLLLSHAYSLRGTANIQGLPIPLEGHVENINAATMAQSIQEFAKKFPDILNKNAARHLSQCLSFAADEKNHTVQQTLKRIQTGKPTCIFTGFSRHSAAVCIWKDLFILSERGGVWPLPLLIYRFDPTKLTEKSLQLLLDIRTKPQKEFKTAFNKTLPAKLRFIQTQNELELQKLVNLSFQKTGNCSWASIEGIVKAYITLAMHESESFTLPALSPEEKDQYKKSIDSAFTSWLLFQQIQLLDKYLENPQDLQLITQSLIALWATKPTNSQLTKQILELESKYYSIATKTEYQDYVTTKIMSSILPYPKAWQHLQTVSETFSYVLSSLKWA